MLVSLRWSPATRAVLHDARDRRGVEVAQAVLAHATATKPAYSRTR